MGTLVEDIKLQTAWIIKAFESDGFVLDYSIKSFVNLDKFFEIHSKNGKAVPGGRLSRNLGNILFSIGGYIGETIIKNVPGAEWETDDSDPQGEVNIAIKLPNGMIIWPAQRTMSRFKNDFEDSIYPYACVLLKDFINEPFDQEFWQINMNNSKNESKPWWKFW
jgi:hypothetical protein